MTGKETLGVLLELFTWIGVALGICFLLVAFLVRTAGGRWVSTTAVIEQGAGAPEARWMSEDGELLSRALDAGEVSELGDADAVTIFYSRYRPERMRFHTRSDAERTWLLLAAILGGLGVASAVAQLVLLFTP